MPRVSSHIYLRGGIYQYRRRVPAELAGKPPFGDREFHRISLMTRNPNEARREAVKHDELIDGMLSAARGRPKVVVGDGPPPQPDERAILSDSYVRNLQAHEFEAAMRVDQRYRELAETDTDSLEAEHQERLDDWDIEAWASFRDGDKSGIAIWRKHTLAAVSPKLEFEAQRFGKPGQS